MNEKKIDALISRFESSTLTVMEIEEENFKIRLEKGNNAVPSEKQIIQATPVAESSAIQAAEPADDHFRKIKSPIVGVYYQAASPDEPPYAAKGDKVKKGQVLCLVEAMKMMNELKSPVDGIIKSISGVNGELVEFDQVLFEVEPC